MQERPFKNLITRSFLEETESQLNKHTKTVATVMKDALQATEKEVEMVTDHHLKDVKAEDHHQAISALHARRRGIGKEIAQKSVMVVVVEAVTALEIER